MNQSEMLNIALGAVRSQARRQRINPETLSADDAVLVLGDLLRSDPTTDLTDYPVCVIIIVDGK